MSYGTLCVPGVSEGGTPVPGPTTVTSESRPSHRRVHKDPFRRGQSTPVKSLLVSLTSDDRRFFS